MSGIGFSLMVMVIITQRVVTTSSAGHRYWLIFDLERHPKGSFDGGEECYIVHRLYDSTAYSLDTV